MKLGRYDGASPGRAHEAFMAVPKDANPASSWGAAGRAGHKLPRWLAP